MSDDPDSPPPEPTIFALARAVCAIGVVVLAALDLATSATEVPDIVYGILGGISGGPELVKRWQQR